MQIELYDEEKFLDTAQEELILNILQYAGGVLKIEDQAEMSVTLVDNDEIQAINKEYRSKDRPTDVISFAIEDESDNDDYSLDLRQFGIPRQLGDIIISFDQLKEQAHSYGHSLERELGFLCVHGFLHLNGYDHQNEADEKRMFSLQESILEGFGLER
ncbi:MAG: rRNA maturation RNase YbeY [Atopococcus tabaci]|uniref:Endoribonuclease YbeY n=1 Tax=Atopococcus tabaci TaxID=269774 RepID=A0AA43UBJ8_9LACT|nr:rRNA maturation RNase YbeY [Atopococcus tabaci]